MDLFRKIRLFTTPNYENVENTYTLFETTINNYIKTLKIDELSPHEDEAYEKLIVTNVEIKISTDSDRAWVMVIRTLKKVTTPK